MQSTAEDVLQLVRQLRPHWVAGYAPEEVAVYLDGERIGNLASLRGMVPEQVASVRFYSAPTFRRLRGRPVNATGPDRDARVVLEIIRPSRLLQRERLSVALYGSAAEVAPGGKELRAAFEASGSDWTDATKVGMGLWVSIRATVQGRIGAEILAGRGSALRVEAVEMTEFGPYQRNASRSSTITAALASYNLGWGHISAGPAVYATEWTRSFGSCACYEREDRMVDVGLLGKAGLTGLPRMRFAPSVGLQLHYIPVIQLEPYRDVPATRVSGVAADVVFGLGVRF